MSDTFDPKELKVLSDILALVLEDQPGQSANALAAIRARAQRNKMTGGALKNLFVAIAPNPPSKAAPKPRATRAAGSSTSLDMQAARAQIAQLTESLNKLDLDLRAAKARNEALRSELYLTQQARAESQAELLTVRTEPAARHLFLVALAFIVGSLLGIAGTQFLHEVTASAPHSNIIYLH